MQKVHTYWGRLGDLMLSCQTCRVVRRAPDDLVSLLAPEPAMPATVTGYVCRDHYRPVTPAGKGCARCVADMRPRHQRRQPAPQDLGLLPAV